jgi:hypothetical protein
MTIQQVDTYYRSKELESKCEGFIELFLASLICQLRTDVEGLWDHGSTSKLAINDIDIKNTSLVRGVSGEILLNNICKTDRNKYERHS